MNIFSGGGSVDVKSFSCCSAIRAVLAGTWRTVPQSRLESVDGMDGISTRFGSEVVISSRP